MVRLHREFILIVNHSMMEGEGKVFENMPMYDYKDKASTINKLIDTNAVFLEINQEIITEEDDKNKVKPEHSDGEKKTTATFREATRLMTRTQDLFK